VSLYQLSINNRATDRYKVQGPDENQPKRFFADWSQPCVLPLFLERIAQFCVTAPYADWSGVWSLAEK
jgi:hypothetical protein